MAVITAVLVAGALGVGSGLLRLASVLPPSPDASLITRPTSPSPRAKQTESTSGSWTAAGQMKEFRDVAMVATLMSDGRVLVVGGNGTGVRKDAASTSAELFDPSSGNWAETGSMQSQHRSGHTATSLQDGTMLVAGGSAYPETPGAGPGPTSVAELLDPRSGQYAGRRRGA